METVEVVNIFELSNFVDLNLPTYLANENKVLRDHTPLYKKCNILLVYPFLIKGTNS